MVAIKSPEPAESALLPNNEMNRNEAPVARNLISTFRRQGQFFFMMW